MDVDRAALVPPRVHGHELHDAVGIGDLGAAQVLLVVGAAATAGPSARGRLEARVRPERVAMPQVHHGVLQRLAGVGVPHPDRQSQARPLTVLTDVAADRVGVEVVRTLGLFGRQRAGGRVVEQVSGRGAGPGLRLHGRRAPVGGGHVRGGVAVAATSACGDQRAQAHGSEGGQRPPAIEARVHGRARYWAGLREP